MQSGQVWVSFSFHHICRHSLQKLWLHERMTGSLKISWQIEQVSSFSDSDCAASLPWNGSKTADGCKKEILRFTFGFFFKFASMAMNQQQVQQHSSVPGDLSAVVGKLTSPPVTRPKQTEQKSSPTLTYEVCYLMPIWSKNEENTFHKVACLMQSIPHITGLSASDDCYRASLCFKLINISDIGRYIEREHAQTVS